jgi:TPR repeat protein
MRTGLFGVSAMAMLLVLSGCTRSDAARSLPDVPADIKKQLAFSCTHEATRIPPRDPEADQLYKHARWLVKANVLKQESAAYPPIERLLRIATAHGHDRANIELRSMLDKDQAHSADPVNEAIDLVQDLIKRGIPAGYYDMGWYVDHGYGVDADQELAFKYYRKAADLGNPEGQYLILLAIC